MTGILATVKPGESLADDVGRLSVLARIGVTAIRVNLGRRSLADNQRLLLCAATCLARAPLLFADLPGVKGRLGDLGAASLPIAPGDLVTLDLTRPAGSDLDAIPYRAPRGESPPAVGDLLALDDGRVLLRVQSVAGERIRCRVEAGVALPRFTGVIIAGMPGPHGHLTAADRELAAAVAPHLDYVCPSFADSAATVETLKRPATRPRRGIIAKIESPRGVAAIDALADAAAGVMLARGDLSIFYSDEQMEHIAATMTGKARDRGKLVVFASNYLLGLAAPPYRLTDRERRTLDRVGALAPDYLLLNETAYSPNWEQIAATAVACARSWA